MTVQFLISSKIAEHKIFEQLEKGIYKTYSFSRQQVQWIKKDKELLVDGKMFDVKHFSENGELIEMTGLFDNEENSLQEKYLSLVTGKQTTSPRQLMLLKIFFIPFLAAYSESEETAGCFTPCNLHHLFNEAAVTAVRCICTPPPEQVAVA